MVDDFHSDQIEFAVGLVIAQVAHFRLFDEIDLQTKWSGVCLQVLT